MNKSDYEELEKTLAATPLCPKCCRFHPAGPCPPQVCMVDHLSLLVTPDKTPWTFEEMASLTRRLKSLSKECNVTILLPRAHT
jgi:hypothetical protein